MIITAYQGAEMIGGAVESALAQTLPPDEIVICDDGSTDDLDGALALYLGRIVLVRKENGGHPSALNAAARAASSEFVVQLDHDDRFLPERIEAIAELAVARPDLDVIATDALLELEGRTLARRGDFHWFPVDAEDQRAEILRHGFFGWPAIRRKRLLAIGGFDESLRIASDWDCWIRLILDGCLVGLVDKPLYRYCLRPGSNSSIPSRSRRALVIVLEKLRNEPSLTPKERLVVEEGIRLHSRRATLFEAKESLLAGGADARRLALGVTFGRGFRPRSRVKAGLSALAPSLARRLMERRIAASETGGIELEHR